MGRHPLIAAKAIYTQTASYGTPASLVTKLTKQEPELSYTTAASSKATTINVWTNGTPTTAARAGQQLVITSYSASSSAC